MGKRTIIGTVLAAAVLSLAAAPAALLAAPPQTIAYQGYLSTSAGTPVNGAVTITFSLYTAPAVETALWSETQAGVQVTNGVYAVILGTVTPLTLAFDRQYWLGVKIGADAEMSPRHALASAPYAFRAAQAEGVKYASDRTGYLNVHASAFLPQNSTTSYGSAVPGTYRYPSPAAGSKELDASVSLPHGVELTDLRCWVTDDSAAGDISFLGLVDALTNTWQCGPTSSGGASPSIQALDASCFSTLVDNTSSLYYLRFGVSDAAACETNCRIYGCRLTYTYTEEGR